MKWLAIAVGLALVAASTGCRAPARDAFTAAEQALLKSDLPAALQQFDAVPIAHPRYPEARAAAAGVERRMRRSHENLLDGLLLRAEWRDREALAALQRAREIWPSMPGVEVLIRATEQRLALFAAPDAAGVAVVAEVGPVVLPQLSADDLRVPELVPPAAAPLAETAAPAPVVVPPPVPGKGPARDDAVARALVDVEAQLGSGDCEGAVDELVRLAEQHPTEARVKIRLVRVLHQRALVRYGQGSLAAAISDWEHLLQLEPSHAVARSLLDAARAEAAGQSAPGR